jgi:arylsulfatase A
VTGAGSNQPLRGSKGTTWEGGFRVPCIIRWPGMIKAGATTDHIVASMDFLPTIAGLAGAKAPQDRIIDGQDLRPILQGEPKPSAYDERGFFYYHRDNLCAVRSGKWKLHIHNEKEPEFRALYDLDADIAETVDVRERNPDVVARLEALAAAARDDLGDDLTGDPGANCRPAGCVANPKPLAEYDEHHPYFIANYDLGDAG